MYTWFLVEPLVEMCDVETSRKTESETRHPRLVQVTSRPGRFVRWRPGPKTLGVVGEPAEVRDLQAHYLMEPVVKCVRLRPTTR